MLIAHRKKNKGNYQNLKKQKNIFIIQKDEMSNISMFKSIGKIVVSGLTLLVKGKLLNKKEGAEFLNAPPVDVSW